MSQICVNKQSCTGTHAHFFRHPVTSPITTSTTLCRDHLSDHPPWLLFQNRQHQHIFRNDNSLTLPDTSMKTFTSGAITVELLSPFMTSVQSFTSMIYFPDEKNHLKLICECLVDSMCQVIYLDKCWWGEFCMKNF